ncbi:MAG: hypothetical protein HQL86_04120, partial [Magnetococcales bacterium]|nr:hypothetical protein [Magnetococcales bacterium]
MVGTWIKRKIVLAALALFGFSASIDAVQAATLTGTLYQNMIAVAVNSTNHVREVAQTQPTAQTSPIPWQFTFANVPVGEDLSIYIFMEGKLFPMVYADGTTTRDAFKLSSHASFDFGTLSIDYLNHVVRPSKLPNTGIAQFSTSAARSSVTLTTIQDTQLELYPNMTLANLIKYGDNMMSQGWFVVADKYYAQALTLAGASTTPTKSQVQVRHAVSQVFAVLNTARSVANTVTTNYANGTATLGDLLAGFGCDKRHLGLSGMVCAAALPSASPTGSDIKGWLTAYAIPKVTAAIGEISQVPNTMTGFTYRDQSDPWDAGTLIDYADVLVIKGILEAGLSQLYWITAYDWGVDVSASQHKTIEEVKSANPNLATLASDSASLLAVSKTNALSAVDDLLTGMSAIQSRTGTQTNNLFTLKAAKITSATSRLNEIKSSLSASTGIKDELGNVGMYLNLSKIFDGINLRALLPPVLGDEIAGLFPDATMGGVLPDNKYNFAGASLNQDSNGDGIPDVLQSSLRMYVPTTTATITVDGDSADWAGIEPVLTSPANDVRNYVNSELLADTTPYGAADFRRLFLAQDSNKVYLRIERGSDVMPAGFTATYTVLFTAINSPVYNVTYIYLSGNSVNCYQNSQTLTPANFAISGQTVEISCPLTVFKNLTGDYRVDVYSSVWKSNPYTEMNDMVRLASLTFAAKPNLATGGGGGGGTTPTPLSLSTTTLSVNVGQSASVTVSGGTTPYSFMIDPPSAGVISLSNTTTSGTTVTCLKAGTSTLQIPDSGTGSQAQMGSVAVTCNALSTPLT